VRTKEEYQAWQRERLREYRATLAPPRPIAVVEDTPGDDRLVYDALADAVNHLANVVSQLPATA
jgi:hypothetical protein